MFIWYNLKPATIVTAFAAVAETVRAQRAKRTDKAQSHVPPDALAAGPQVDKSAKAHANAWQTRETEAN